MRYPSSPAAKNTFPALITLKATSRPKFSLHCFSITFSSVLSRKLAYTATAAASGEVHVRNLPNPFIFWLITARGCGPQSYPPRHDVTRMKPVQTRPTSWAILRRLEPTCLGYSTNQGSKVEVSPCSRGLPGERHIPEMEKGWKKVIQFSFPQQGSGSDCVLDLAMLP